MSEDDERSPQPVSEHGAMSPADSNFTYSKYVTGDVYSLQDQIDNGGWLPSANPINSEPPMLDVMGTAWNEPHADDDDNPVSDTLSPGI